MATVKELRERAKAAGIKGYSRMRKAELECALSKLNQPESTESTKSTKATVKKLSSLRGLPSYEAFKAARDENVAAIVACETREELEEMLKSLDAMSRWITAHTAMIEICGDAPDWIIGGWKTCAGLVMHAKAKREARLA